MRRRRAAVPVVVAVLATLPAMAGGAAAQSTPDGVGDPSAPSASEATTGAIDQDTGDGVTEAGTPSTPSVLDGPPPAAGPEPLWVPDPEKVSESAEKQPAPADAEASAPIAVDDVPAADASRVAIAHWMATAARAAGLPGELPVMAALVESSLSNIPYGDADSVGFFQMRQSIWDHGEYAGYLARPELQVRWFIDHATAVRDTRRAAGDATYGEDPATWGEWIADVEQPYAPYRGRYQLRLDEARGLLAQPADTVSPLELGLTVGGPSMPVTPASDSSGDELAKRVLADSRITLDPRARSDLETPGRVDPRLCAVLLDAAKLYPISIWVIQTGHSYYTVGGSVSNHSSGRAADIGSVDGEVVTPTNEKAHKLALALGKLSAPLRPTEIGSPWAIDDPAYFTDADHQNHLHVGYDDPPVAGDAAAVAAMVPDGAAPAAPHRSVPGAEPYFQAGDAKTTDDDAAAEPRFQVGG